MNPIHSVDIFCRVIDNFGDAGVCWRLARALARAGLSVRLWMDDLHRLQRLRPDMNTALPRQSLDGFTLLRWDDASPEGYQPADLVIEAFACRMPDPMLDALAAAVPRPAWINLDYLTAERWAKDSHGLPSPHPRLPLTQYFYFPGFESGTGGLIREADLDDAKHAFDAKARSDFLSRLGVHSGASQSSPSDRLPPNNTDRLLVSLFCYPIAPVDALFAAMQTGPRVCCLVPEGVASDAVRRLTGGRADPGTEISIGQLNLKVIPFLEPDDYDRLLWSCDLNFVRGEDSLVRAHWAQQPFIWQLYPQEERAHLAKMEAFLDVFLAQDNALLWGRSVRDFWQAWNEHDAAAMMAGWPGLCAALPLLAARAGQWAAQVASVGELSRGIVEWAGKIR